MAPRSRHRVPDLSADNQSLAAVPGVTVGHVTDRDDATGCTVVLGPADGMRAAGYIRGRATGTREFDALSPHHVVSRIDAVLLTGGSAFGLGAADGVMRWLAERERGFAVGVRRVPIVPAAVVFDLALGSANTWPGPADGYTACDAASSTVAEGSVGAGTGATVGKAFGLDRAMKGGVGTWAATAGDVIVGALVVVNAFGDVRDGGGRILAGARSDDGFADTRRHIAEHGAPVGRFGNTTLVVVGTNVVLERTQLREVARSAADALSWRIAPVGTQVDGDVVFALSAGTVPVDGSLQVELLAQDVTVAAVERAVRFAEGIAGVPGVGGDDQGTVTSDQ